MTLHVDFCSFDAAKFAVTRWHYSEAMPAGRLVQIGAWEDGKFVGTILFSHGATHKLAEQWGLDRNEACEMTRVAFRRHKAPVTQALSKALTLLRETNPTMRLVISFSDPVQQHHGGIYQAGNWIYTGASGRSVEFIVNGIQYHARSIHAKGWKQTVPWLQENIDPDARSVRVPGKHRYLMPLDRAMRRRIVKHSQPYPERVIK